MNDMIFYRIETTTKKRGSLAEFVKARSVKKAITFIKHLTGKKNIKPENVTLEFRFDELPTTIATSV